MDMLVAPLVPTAQPIEAEGSSSWREVRTGESGNGSQNDKH